MNFRFVQLALQAAEEYGVVASRHEGWTEGLVVVLEDDPSDASARQELASVLGALVDTRLVELVGMEGAFGDIDTSWLGDVADDELRATMCNAMLDSLTLSPAQYCHIFARRPFTLIGLEDKDAYRQATRLLHELPAIDEFAHCGAEGPRKRQLDIVSAGVRELYPEVAEYSRLLSTRAELMLSCLLTKMVEMRVQSAAVVASAPLLDLVCEGIAEHGMSYARIEPARGVGDLEGYERRLREQARARGESTWADA